VSSPLSLEVLRLNDEESAVVASEDAYDSSDAVEQSEGRRWEDEEVPAHVPVLVCSLLCAIRP